MPFDDLVGSERQRNVRDGTAEGSLPRVIKQQEDVDYDEDHARQDSQRRNALKRLLAQFAAPLLLVFFFFLSSRADFYGLSLMPLLEMFYLRLVYFKSHHGAFKVGTLIMVIVFTVRRIFVIEYIVGLGECSDLFALKHLRINSKIIHLVLQFMAHGFLLDVAR